MSRSCARSGSDVRDDPRSASRSSPPSGERHFCTGFDVAEAEGPDASRVFDNRPLAEVVHWSPHQNRVWKPVLCAVQGLCVGRRPALRRRRRHRRRVRERGLHGCARERRHGGRARERGPRPAPPARRGAAHDPSWPPLPDAGAPRLRARASSTSWWRGPPTRCRPRSRWRARCSRTRRRRWRSRSRPSGAASSTATPRRSSRRGACCGCTGATPTSARARALRREAAAALEPGPERSQRRIVNAAFSADEERFRTEVREFLTDWRDLDAFFLQGHQWPRVPAFFSALAERGWLSLGWPAGAGGSGKPLSYEYILWDEVAYARAARQPLASGIVAKTIARCGDAAQRERWLPPIRARRDPLLARLLGARGRLRPREPALPRRAARRNLRRDGTEVLAVLRAGHGLPLALVRTGEPGRARPQPVAADRRQARRRACASRRCRRSTATS